MRIRALSRIGIALLLCAVVPVFCEGAAPQSWRNVQYLGGAPEVKEISASWDNQLTISPGAIQITLVNGRVIEIPADNVIAISFSGKRIIREALAHRINEIFYFTFKAKDYYIGIEFARPDKPKAGVLLRAHKKNFADIVSALRALPNMVDESPEARHVK